MYQTYPLYIGQPYPEPIYRKPVYRAKFKKGTFRSTYYPDERITDVTYDSHCCGLFSHSGRLNFTLLDGTPCHVSNLSAEAADYFLRKLEETGVLDLTEEYCGYYYRVD